MAHKKQHGAPVPKGNRPRRGGAEPATNTEQPKTDADGTGFNEQDPKRRLGNYGGAGEHPFTQPGGRNDANR